MKKKVFGTVNQSIIGKVIERKIWIIREQRVMLDSDLANLYGVETFNLNKAVKRNLDRFPEDFMFQLDAKEWDSLIFQIGISKEGKGGRRFLPYVFTEGGVAMLSSVLNSERAIQTNVVIIRTFIKMREVVADHRGVLEKLDNLVKRVDTHDLKLQQVFQAIRDLVVPYAGPKRPIGIRSGTK